MFEETVDFAAVGRVAKRAELRAIRLAQLSANSEYKKYANLIAQVEHDCKVLGRENDLLDIGCEYRFVVLAGDAKSAQATIHYVMQYQLQGKEPFADDDLAQFAFANGVYHSWPFVRELIYGLTAKMGFPPYTLPVMKFYPKPKKTEQAKEKPKEVAKEEGA